MLQPETKDGAAEERKRQYWAARKGEREGPNGFQQEPEDRAIGSIGENSLILPSPASHTDRTRPEP